MSDKRQNNQLLLAFVKESRSEAPRLSTEGTEWFTAERGTESPAIGSQQDTSPSITPRSTTSRLSAEYSGTARIPTARWRLPNRHRPSRCAAHRCVWTRARYGTASGLQTRYRSRRDTC